MIPKSIDRHIIGLAAKEVARTGVPLERASRKWSVIVGRRSFPPKYLLSVAARIATGRALAPSAFEAGQAREFLRARGFPFKRSKANISLAADKNPQMKSSGGAVLRLTWRDSRANGYSDLLPLSLLTSKKKAIEHVVLSPSGRRSRAKCRVRVHGTVTELDYTPFRSFNQSHDNDLGVARMTFADRDRTQLTELEWMDEAAAKFEPAPFQASYSLDAKAPYIPPTTSSAKSTRRIRERPGQVKFRQDLKIAYGDRCCMTGCHVAEALEGAHIDPYRGPASDHVRNGLLLRRDIHRLFDLAWIGIDPQTMRIHVRPAAAKWKKYQELHGRKIRRPKDPNDHPDKGALERQWERFAPASPEI